MDAAKQTIYDGIIHDSPMNRLYHFQGRLYRLEGNRKSYAENVKIWNDMNICEKCEFIKDGMLICDYLCEVMSVDDKHEYMRKVNAHNYKLIAEAWARPRFPNDQNKDEITIIKVTGALNKECDIIKLSTSGTKNIAIGYNDAIIKTGHDQIAIGAIPIDDPLGINIGANNDKLATIIKKKPISPQKMAQFTCPLELRDGPIHSLADTLRLAKLHERRPDYSGISGAQMIQMENYHRQVIFLQSFANAMLLPTTSDYVLAHFIEYLKLRDADPIVKFDVSHKEILMEMIDRADMDDHMNIIHNMMPAILNLNCFNMS